MMSTQDLNVLVTCVLFLPTLAAVICRMEHLA